MNIKKILSLSLFILTIIFIFCAGYIQNLKNGVKDSVLRLHIVADSDSAYDQRLKIYVRDRILDDFKEELEDLPDKTSAVAWASDNLDKICKSARDELLKHNSNLDVKCEVKDIDFPTKTYGSIALPRGKYMALNVKIGKALGQNWWCVMYPPLCVTDKSAVIGDKSKQHLKNALSPQEYDLISENPQIKIKFRIAELLR